MKTNILKLHLHMDFEGYRFVGHIDAKSRPG